MRNLLLPVKPILAINLRRRRKLSPLIQQPRADDNHIRAQNLLVVVDVRGAVLAVVAVGVVAC